MPGAEREEFWSRVANAEALLPMLDYLPDTVVFVKDRDCRYVFANRTLAERLAVRDTAQLVGKRAEEVFPSQLGVSYSLQDQRVLEGAHFVEHLELHLYPTGNTGWCLTTKYPLSGHDGLPVGVVGISRDVHVSLAAAPGLASALTTLQQRYSEPLRIQELADEARMSLSSFERHVKRVYGLTPAQLVTRARINAATELLRGTDHSIARVAVECGYFDHSAFTRAFKTAVGVTPAQFRLLIQGKTEESNQSTRKRPD